MSNWDSTYKGPQPEPEGPYWPAVVVILSGFLLIAFIAWMIFGGGCE